jgi:hypothetical protein
MLTCSVRIEVAPAVRSESDRAEWLICIDQDQSEGLAQKQIFGAIRPLWPP